MTYARPILASATIAYALAFNIPYVSRIFEYPGILREPAGQVMTLFASGGSQLDASGKLAR